LSKIPTISSMLVSKCWTIDDIMNSIALLIIYLVMRSVVGRKQSLNGSRLPRMQILEQKAASLLAVKDWWVIIYPLSLIQSFCWGGWCIENENKESITLSSQKWVCDECVLISYCARSVRDAEKRDTGLCSQSYTLITFIFGILNEISFSHSFPYLRVRTTSCDIFILDACKITCDVTL